MAKVPSRNKKKNGYKTFLVKDSFYLHFVIELLSFSVCLKP